MRRKLLWSCSDVWIFSPVVAIYVPGTMCVAVLYGKSQLLWPSSKWQSSGGNIVGNNWVWVDFESSATIPSVMARQTASTEI